jgi:hypothetical protein
VDLIQKKLGKFRVNSWRLCGVGFERKRTCLERKAREMERNLYRYALVEDGCGGPKSCGTAESAPPATCCPQPPQHIVAVVVPTVENPLFLGENINHNSRASCSPPRPFPPPTLCSDLPPAWPTHNLFLLLSNSKKFSSPNSGQI